MSTGPIFIVGGKRTPFTTWSSGTDGSGRKGGALKGSDHFDLAAAALKGALADARLAPEDIDRVYFGNSYHAGSHSCYGGKYVAHRAGIADSAPGLAVCLACGSGLYSMIVAAQELHLGLAGLAAATGADSSSLIRRAVLIPSFTDISCGEHISATAEKMALSRGFDRAALDRWARTSHERALEARGRGLLAEEIVPVGEAAQDDAILEDPSPAHFEASEPLFEGSIMTHANTHAMVDGGAALLLATEEGLKRCPAASPRAKLLASAVASMDPRKMALAAAIALREAVSRAGLELGDIDLFEINETFAAQALLDMAELSLPEEKVNVRGGAIALGHAFGGTGGRIVLALLHELGRRGARRGAAAISLGGGQGVAVVVESI